MQCISGLVGPCVVGHFYKSKCEEKSHGLRYFFSADGTACPSAGVIRLIFVDGYVLLLFEMNARQKKPHVTDPVFQNFVIFFSRGFRPVILSKGAMAPWGARRSFQGCHTMLALLGAQT